MSMGSFLRLDEHDRSGLTADQIFYSYNPRVTFVADNSYINKRIGYIRILSSLDIIFNDCIAREQLTSYIRVESRGKSNNHITSDNITTYLTICNEELTYSREARYAPNANDPKMTLDAMIANYTYDSIKLKWNRLHLWESKVTKCDIVL